MKQKLVIGSVIIAAVIILTSMSSVIGKNSSQIEYDSMDSPLFKARSHPKSLDLATSYIGNGKSVDWIKIDSNRYNGLISKALDILNSNSAIRDNVIKYVEDNPRILALLDDYNLDFEKLKMDLDEQLQNPEDLIPYISKYVADINGVSPPEPLGLSTSNPIGCFVVVIAMLPLLLILTVMIATITIVTCLNVGGCFEAIWTQIGEAFIQGLNPP
jgi:hypothetical protein